MPKIFTVGSVRIMIYPNDHNPPHVHAVGADGTARFALNCPDGPAEAMDSKGFRHASLDQLGLEITRRLTECCTMWSVVHG